jgi:DNA-binding CsgD family transcriptional regulator
VVVFSIPVLGFIELSLGNARATHELLGPLVTRCAEMPIREPGFLRFVPDEVEALVTLGDLGEAARVLEPFEERSRALDRPYGLAVSSRCRALISAGRGNITAAAAALQQALEHHERVGEPFERGRTMLVMGDVHRRRRQKRAAHDALEEALTIFERLPAPLWAERARGAMDRLGRRPPSRWDLTATERQIAELVATGLTTQEVADKMFLSPRTVSANLSSIYRKLGIRSRTELARRISVGS